MGVVFIYVHFIVAAGIAAVSGGTYTRSCSVCSDQVMTTTYWVVSALYV